MRSPLKALSLLLPLLAAGPLAAQQIVLEEHFDFYLTGVFPPAGWTEENVNANPLSPGWEDPQVVPVNCGLLGPTNVAGHDDHATGSGPHDNRLISPVLDLSSVAAPRLNFRNAICRANAMAVAGQGGDGKSSIEVSTDNGVSWTEIWVQPAVANGAYAGETVDLAAYGGMPQVQIAFRYYGSDAHVWSIDNVFVAEGQTGGTLSMVGSCGTTSAYLFVQNVTPLANIGLCFSPDLGGRIYSSPNCPLLFTGLGAWPARPVAVAQSSGFGTAVFTRPSGIPANVCGRYVQAFDLASCQATNVLQL